MQRHQTLAATLLLVGVLATLTSQATIKSTLLQERILAQLNSKELTIKDKAPANIASEDDEDEDGYELMTYIIDEDDKIDAELAQYIVAQISSYAEVEPAFLVQADGFNFKDILKGFKKLEPLIKVAVKIGGPIFEKIIKFAIKKAINTAFPWTIMLPLPLAQVT